MELGCTLKYARNAINFLFRRIEVSQRAAAKRAGK